MHNLANDRAPHNTLTSEAALIRVDTFQPFESRLGVDVVMRLRFEYDPALVARLKALLAVYAVGTDRKTIGGWLAKHKCWFVEASAWEVVKLELLYLGHQIIKGNA